MKKMEYTTYSTAEHYSGAIKYRPEVVDLEKRLVIMEKEILHLKHRIAELELSGI